MLICDMLYFLTNMQGVSKIALQWYSKCYSLASVTETCVQRWIVCTLLIVNVFLTRHTVTFGITL
jgi:hypothetical protein